MSEPRALRVAIVGSGPSGMYAAGHLLETPGGTFADGRLSRRVNRSVEVDVIDRLPTPWGLIRSGVAPDHPDKKKMSRFYDAIAHRPGFRFIGNVRVGETVTTAELSAWYDAVIYAYGADGERQLGIPGEALPGSHSARRFVGWYNGHPDFSALQFNLQTPRAVIVGNGNVSMNVARILLKPVSELRSTDIAAHALEALCRSQIREVVILGRRGPQEAAFNFPELEELGELPDTAIVVEDAQAAAAVLATVADGDVKLRILRTLITKHRSGSRRVVLRFNASPVEAIGSSAVEGLRVSSGEVIETGLLLAAVGYRGQALPGLPFDEARGVVPSQNGRVLQGNKPLPGTYVTGWIRRGPRGIIGSNKKCARDAVASLLADADAGLLPHTGTLTACEVTEQLRARASLSSYAGWQRIDQGERRAGTPLDRPRIKLTTLGDLMDVASLARPRSVETATS